VIADKDVEVKHVQQGKAFEARNEDVEVQQLK
jgi:hypothetical protein